MQTFITDFDIFKSLNSLDMHRIFSMIYENTHGLGSLLNCVDDLILSDKAKVQVKKLINKPQCKLWIGYEFYLYVYIMKAYNFWYLKFANKKKIRYKETINYKNLEIIKNHLLDNNYKYIIPNWISDELILTHRSVLIQKEIKKTNKINYEINNLIKKSYTVEQDYDLKISKLINKKIKQLENNNHYRNLWPGTSIDLKMHYEWRSN
jgi:hypothetical protein